MEQNDFKIYLKQYVNYGLKTNFLSDDLADIILNKFTEEQQREWLGKMEVREQLAYQNSKEEENHE